MHPKSKGKPVPPGFLSRSTPNLSTLPLEAANDEDASKASPRPARAHHIAGDVLSGHAAIDGQNEDAELLGVTESEDEDAEAVEVDSIPTRRPIYASRSHSQLPRQTASALFPPFYNRPPTPLPPSPSLTSLLRPSFASRPTTPDSSDVEPASTLKPPSGPSTRASSLVKSARHAPQVPRAAPKVPTYEYYGFALYLGSSAAFLMYILWAYVPAPMLHQMGIYYYPNRWWALAIPCWLIALIIYIYVALASYNTGYLTLPMDSVENLVDECAQVAVVERRSGRIARDRVLVADELRERGRLMRRAEAFSEYQFGAGESVDWKGFWSTGTDAVMDVPIGGVCEVLYGGY